MKSIRARAPTASSPLVRRVMQANRSSGTRPEVLLSSSLRQAGLRFRNDARPEPRFKCKADLVFRARKVCIFVDGCYWHGCPKHFRTPRTNADWWNEKIDETRRRDRAKRKHLRECGWTVLRIWEHEITPNIVPRLVKKISESVR
jgi:DNA mismatch endonuclease (patch repair protein)